MAITLFDTVLSRLAHLVTCLLHREVAPRDKPRRWTRRSRARTQLGDPQRALSSPSMTAVCASMDRLRSIPTKPQISTIDVMNSGTWKT